MSMTSLLDHLTSLTLSDMLLKDIDATIVFPAEPLDTYVLRAALRNAAFQFRGCAVSSAHNARLLLAISLLVAIPLLG